jgi:hypothetical protein
LAACEDLRTVPLSPSDLTLVCLQGLLVLVPARTRRLPSSRLLGISIPAAALVVGVGLAQAGGGASFLAALAAIATPVLAALAGFARGCPRPWLPALFVPPLYLLAWLAPDAIAGESAGVALIAAACLAVTALVAAVAPAGWLKAGLVLLVLLDVYLVWGDRQVGPAVTALDAAATPTVLGRHLPSLQQVQLGSTQLGWLDLAAPALLGIIVVPRVRAALATGLAAALWSLLLFATSPIPATPPVLAGLAAASRRFTEPRTRAGGRFRARSAGLAPRSGPGRWGRRRRRDPSPPRQPSGRSRWLGRSPG